jgi:tRNA threonylcarbamoyl adenosine modification protein (Sua5/YciO/YrdC/YwlC family)
MPTEVINLDTARYSDAIQKASSVLEAGGLVIFPTETVYGVGACALLPDAVQKLRVLKSRTDGKPFTVHIGTKSTVTRFVPDISGTGRRLVNKSWPGPLTIIFHVDDPAAAPVIRDSSPEHIAALYHDGTIGIRCPDDHVAVDLLTATSRPVVAASANLAGNPAPLTAEEALRDLDGQVDLVIDAGRTRYNLASTIVEVDGDNCRILREGVLDDRMLQRLNRTSFLVVCSGNTCRSPMGEGLLRRLLAEKLNCREAELPEKGYHVESAGTGAYGGTPATPEAVEVLKARGIDLSGHRSQPLTLEQVNRADYILAMTRRQLESIKAMTGGAEHRVLQVDDQDIEDPIGGTLQDYQECANRIEEALRRRLEEVVR